MSLNTIKYELTIFAVHGNIESMHAFIDMRNVTVRKSRHTRSGRTCKPAMGFAFAAGTTDGPGAFDFKQSDVNGTLFWKIVRDFITTPSREQEDCHMPKPILLDVGMLLILTSQSYEKFLLN